MKHGRSIPSFILPPRICWHDSLVVALARKACKLIEDLLSFRASIPLLRPGWLVIGGPGRVFYYIHHPLCWVLVNRAFPRSPRLKVLF